MATVSSALTPNDSYYYLQQATNFLDEQASSANITIVNTTDHVPVSCTDTDYASDFDEDTKWREEVDKAVTESERKFDSFYNILKGYANASTESLDEISYATTPDRESIHFKETNADCHKRVIYVKYRPLRRWMETKGPKGVALRTLSHLQMAGHWGLTIGPYTYDLYQINRECILYVGQWSTTKRAGEKDRVKSKEVGYTYLTDMQILEIAERRYEFMKPYGYDEKFNNCHRFVSGVARRIASHFDDQNVVIHLRLLYTWHLMPASHFFKAGEYIESFFRVPRYLIAKALSELKGQWGSWSEMAKTMIRHGKVASLAIFFLVTALPMMVFLSSTKDLTNWDPQDREDRARYLQLFERCEIPKGLAQGYLDCAFGGAGGIRRYVDKLIQPPVGGSVKFLKRFETMMTRP